MEAVEVTIMGAGIVGLAIAAELSADHQVLVLEQHDKFGQETSSRSSEVIHAGIYYPPGSLKAQLCVEGNRALYRLCADNGIGHKRLGKIIVATNDAELAELEKIIAHGRGNGATLDLLSAAEVRRMEPNVSSIGGMHSPNTGIVDSHGLMQHFHARAVGSGAMMAYRCKAVGIEKVAEGYRVSVEDQEGSFSFHTRLLINSAGLHSDALAAMAGIDLDKAQYRLHYCKGEYFSLAHTYTSRLVYPVPGAHEGGLGVHITLDLQGCSRLGPNAIYVDAIDYTVDERHLDEFYRSALRLLPAIKREELAPGYAGVRPKLQGEGQPFRDFVIRHEADRGLDGLINLIGIESPGLTASPAIARHVAEMVKTIV